VVFLQFGLVFLTSGKRADQLQLQLLGIKKPDQTRLSNTCHWYLALCKGTKYAVMSMHTVAEKQLFSQLMQTHPPFNQENQDTDWIKTVILWNGNHAKGNEDDLFFKVCSLVY
jgi:hypothetical protein